VRRHVLGGAHRADLGVPQIDGTAQLAPAHRGGVTVFAADHVGDVEILRFRGIVVSTAVQQHHRQAGIDQRLGQRQPSRARPDDAKIGLHVTWVLGVAQIQLHARVYKPFASGRFRRPNFFCPAFLPRLFTPMPIIACRRPVHRKSA